MTAARALYASRNVDDGLVETTDLTWLLPQTIRQMRCPCSHQYALVMTPTAAGDYRIAAHARATKNMRKFTKCLMNVPLLGKSAQIRVLHARHGRDPQSRGEQLSERRYILRSRQSSHKRLVHISREAYTCLQAGAQESQVYLHAYQLREGRRSYPHSVSSSTPSNTDMRLGGVNFSSESEYAARCRHRA